MYVDRCTGICCSRFPIGDSTSVELFKKLNTDDNPEFVKLRKMLIVIPADASVLYDTYTCKHWNKETKLCMDYDNRPDMCVMFPYDVMCQICGGISESYGADENYGWLGEVVLTKES